MLWGRFQALYGWLNAQEELLNKNNLYFGPLCLEHWQCEGSECLYVWFWDTHTLIRFHSTVHITMYFSLQFWWLRDYEWHGRHGNWMAEFHKQPYVVRRRRSRRRRWRSWREELEGGAGEEQELEEGAATWRGTGAALVLIVINALKDNSEVAATILLLQLPSMCYIMFYNQIL